MMLNSLQKKKGGGGVKLSGGPLRGLCDLARL